jgi:hypothetical protein
VTPALRPPSNARLLAAWDAGCRQHPLDRALTLLRAFTGEERNALAALPIGERDELLLAVRERFFGHRLEALCACESCGEPNEFEIDVRLLPPRPKRGDAKLRLDCGSGELEVRLPNSLDLAAVLALDDDEAVRALVARCVSTEAAIDDDALAQLEGAMAEAEALAALDITFTCSVCGAANEAPFDAETFLWNDVGGACRRLLLDVDVLASAYGWRETEILALAAERRAAYVDLARR